LQVLFHIVVQFGMLFPEDFAQAVDIAAKCLVGAAADLVEAAQLAIGTATFQEVFLELFEFCIQFGTIRLAVFELGLLEVDLFHAFSHLIQGGFIGHNQGCFLQDIAVFRGLLHMVEGDVFFIADGAGKDLDQGLGGEIFIWVLNEETQSAGALQMKVV